MWPFHKKKETAVPQSQQNNTSFPVQSHAAAHGYLRRVWEPTYKREPDTTSDTITGMMVGGALGGAEGMLLGGAIGGIEGGIIGGEIASFDSTPDTSSSSSDFGGFDGGSSGGGGSDGSW